MKDMFSNLITVMSSLSIRMDQMEGGCRKKMKVAFHSRPPTPKTASLPDAAPAPATHLPPPRPQPHGSQDGPVLTPSVPKQPPLPGVDHMCLEVPFQEGTPLHLSDVSEEVQTRVVQHPQGGPAPFLLMGEDSPTD